MIHDSRTLFYQLVIFTLWGKNGMDADLVTSTGIFFHTQESQPSNRFECVFWQISSRKIHATTSELWNLPHCCPNIQRHRFGSTHRIRAQPISAAMWVWMRMYRKVRMFRIFRRSVSETKLLLNLDSMLNCTWKLSFEKMVTKFVLTLQFVISMVTRTLQILIGLILMAELWTFETDVNMSQPITSVTFGLKSNSCQTLVNQCMGLVMDYLSPCPYTAIDRNYLDASRLSLFQIGCVP